MRQQKTEVLPWRAIAPGVISDTVETPGGFMVASLLVDLAFKLLSHIFILHQGEGSIVLQCRDRPSLLFHQYLCTSKLSEALTIVIGLWVALSYTWAWVRRILTYCKLQRKLYYLKKKKETFLWLANALKKVNWPLKKFHKVNYSISVLSVIIAVWEKYNI